MDDARVWGSETGLWTGDEENYRKTIDAECLMVVPVPPFVFKGEAAVKAVSDTPRWDKVVFSAQEVSRVQEGLIVIAYMAHAERAGVAPYEAHCTTTYRMIEHGVWRVVQHQQTPPLMAAG